MATTSQKLRISDVRITTAEMPWYEEPLPTWDHEGTATLARELDTPIANDETEYTRYGSRN
ncbi:MAG: enolase C-terminal domain-like protein [Caldimonas sp.]